MPSLPLYDMSKKKVGSIDVNDTVFASEVKEHLIHDAVRYQIALRYQFKTANARTRTEVQGTRKKVYKQKGTGQARHGDAKAPIFVGGGKAHGPKPRRVVKKLNKKVMRAALTSALSLRQKQDQLFVIDRLELKKRNCKTIADFLKSFGVTKALLINGGDADVEKFFNESARNLQKIKQLKPEGVNVYDVLKYDNLIISQKALEKVTERLTHV